MSFIVSNKADIVKLESLEVEARKPGAPYSMEPREVLLTLFTDDPSWETRQKLEVTTVASATSDGLVLDLVAPIAASLTFGYDPSCTRRNVRFIVEVIEEPDDGEPTRLEVDEDTKTTAEHLLDYFRPVIQQREAVAA